jgi:branched-chain amino acid transport system permease protein
MMSSLRQLGRASRPGGHGLAVGLGGGAVLAFVAPAVLGEFQIELLATYLIFSLVAIGLDLIWGYTGIISIGQFAFFGMGGYCMALITTHVDVAPVAVGIAAAIVLTALSAAALAFLFFSIGLDDLFVLVTIAVSVILTTLATTQTKLLGGNNGLSVPDAFVPFDIPAFYLVVVAVVMLVYIGSAALVSSRVGTVLRAIRESEERVAYLGYNTKAYKVGVFALSAGMTGLAGALYALLKGFVTPDQLGFGLSFDAIVWVVVGGLGTLWGPVVGTLLVNFAEFYFSEALVSAWLLVVGVLFILAVTFFPDGLAGALKRGLSHVAWRRRGLKPIPVPEEGRES